MSVSSQKIYLIGDGWGFDSAKTGLSCVFQDVECLKVLDSSIRNGTVIFAGYKPIVPHNFLKNNTCINIHYSLLPRYRGFHSTVWAILNDEDYLGLSIHLMTDYIDDGAIIHQKVFKNDRVRNSREYMEMFNRYVAENLGHIILDYINGHISLKENNKINATWVGKRNHQDCKIDFSRDLNYQKCFFRALVDPYPLPFVEYKGMELVVTNVDYYSQNVETHLGRILNIDNEGLWVKVKDGYLIIKELIDSNNNVVPFDRFKIGQFFNK